MDKISEALCWVKQARYKSLHTIWFHVYDILKMQNLREKSSLAKDQKQAEEIDYGGALRESYMTVYASQNAPDLG